TMTDVNAPAELAPTMAPPTRIDDQILPHIRWVPIGKRNCYLGIDRPRSNPIFKIMVDLQKHTNFFRAFTASLAIPAIYIQQDALQITPVDRNNAFSSPPTPDALIKFVNDLGYPKVVRHLSDVGVINRAHIDYAERMWEEFTQSIYTFIEDKKNLAQHTQGKKKSTLIMIPSIRFTKLIIHYLLSKHKFHARPGKQYYNSYLDKVAKHQRYIAGEDVSDPDSPAPKPTKRAKPKTTKKPTSTQQTKPKTDPSFAKTTKSTPSQLPKPKPAHAKPQEKKRKRALDAAKAPSQA
ncbi:hypothetical protein Tco_0215798, partial [Tanacetum coccineum]